MSEEPEIEGLGGESSDVVAEAKQAKGAGSKKKNKWKTVTADFYQPRPYESDQGKDKAGGAPKGATGKGTVKGSDDFGAKGGRGGKGKTPQQDDERPPRPALEELAKPPPLDTPLADIDSLGARGVGAEGSPKRKPLGGKPRDAKGRGKGKQSAARKGMGPFPGDSSQDFDRPRPVAPVQPQRTPLVLSSGQPAMGMGQQPAMAQQMLQQGVAMPQQFASFGGQGFSTGAPGGVVYQNTQAMPAMYAMPYYVPVQMAPAQMAVRSPSAIYTTSPQFVPAGGQPAGAPGVPGVAPDRATLKVQVQQQIEYYFDVENLLKDMYLRRNMTDEGWVAVWLVAGFRRVQNMTTDVSIVVEAIQASNKVELDVQMQFVRPKDNWQQWIISGAGAPTPQREMPAAGLSGLAGAP